MRKLYTIQKLNYTVFMEIIGSKNVIVMTVCNGSLYEYREDTMLFKKNVRKYSLLSLFGISLENRTHNAMASLIRKMKRHADKQASKYDRLYKAYNETKEIFTLDEHIGI